jgi:hypothetical protein
MVDQSLCEMRLSEGECYLAANRLREIAQKLHAHRPVSLLGFRPRQLVPFAVSETLRLPFNHAQPSPDGQEQGLTGWSKEIDTKIVLFVLIFTICDISVTIILPFVVYPVQ